MLYEEYFKGRGAQFNPKNRFFEKEYVAEHIEGLDEPFQENPKTKLFYESPKNIVNKVKSPDVPLDYSLNPYQGCEHGCIYCYARNTHEYWGFSAGIDFESKIIVKPDAPNLLEKTFLRPKWKVSPIMLSGNTDCYQPLERKLKITRALLKVFAKFKHPVGIITKNSLITRDIDILQELAKDNLVHVLLSITSFDETLRRKMEPRTASGINRLKTIEKLSNAGISTGIMVAPIIPSLNSQEIPEIIKRSAEAGATTAGMTMVRLNGAIQFIFKDWLEKTFPERANKVWNQIEALHGGRVNDSVYGRRMSGSGPVAHVIRALFRNSVSKYMHDKKLAPLNITKFRRLGMDSLF